MKIVNWFTSALGQKDAGEEQDQTPSLALTEAQESTPTVYPQKRRYPRFSVENLGISSKAVISGKACIANISAGGACIVSRMPLGTGNNILMRIHQKRLPGPLLGKVVWDDRSRSASSQDNTLISSFKAGIQFRDINPITLDELQGFMRSSGFPDEKRSTINMSQHALRYILPGKMEALVDYLVTCSVKKISMGGMLIEASLNLKLNRSYLMSVSLPSEPVQLKFIGRIASRVPVAGDASDFDFGIEFSGLSEDDRKRLKRFIAGLLWKNEA